MLGEIIWNKDMIETVLKFSIPLVTIIGGIWYQLERTRSRNELKRSMVERGMSADEIERVLAARVSK
jgi:hypothetical protein